MLPSYFADAAAAMKLQSQSIRRDFASHRPASGHNREGVLGTLLRGHLPAAFGVDTGLVVAQSGQFSNQADLVITDATLNAPLYASSPERLILCESVYALIEVKSNLSPSEIADSVAKCRRFKKLTRTYLEPPHARPQLRDSLFVIFAFDGPGVSILKANLVDALTPVPRNEQPDFIVVHGQSVTRSGSYLEVATIGQDKSEHRNQLLKAHGPDLSALVPILEMDDFQENALFAWYVWFLSWLKHAGPRQADLLSYLPPGMIFGRRVE